MSTELKSETVCAIRVQWLWRASHDQSFSSFTFSSIIEHVGLDFGGFVCESEAQAAAGGYMWLQVATGGCLIFKDNAGRSNQALGDSARLRFFNVWRV